MANRALIQLERHSAPDIIVIPSVVSPLHGFRQGALASNNP